MGQYLNMLYLSIVSALSWTDYRIHLSATPRRGCVVGLMPVLTLLLLLGPAVAVSTTSTVSILPGDAQCGDRVCNLRRESHFDCPSDCTGSYYVVDGNNASCKITGRNAGRSTESPFCELSQAVDRVEPGDTVYIRGGTQRLKKDTFLRTGGKPGEFVTFRNYPDETPILESGIPYHGGWKAEPTDSSANYRIFSSRKSVRDFYDFRNEHGHSRIAIGIDNPLTRLLTLHDLKTLHSLPGLPGPVDAYYADCSTGTIYLRLFDHDSNPDDEPIHFTTYRRLYLRGASYVRIIGLTFQHAIDSIKINSAPPSGDQNLPSYKKTAQHIQLYDNTFRSTNMAITDIAYDPDEKNHLVIEGNVFRNIGPLIEIEKNGDHGRDIKCSADLRGHQWRYVLNRWDHAIYGSTRGTIFSGNDIDMGGTWTGVMATEGDYSDNRIVGDITTKQTGPGHHNFTTRIYNNVISQPHGRPLFIRYFGTNYDIHNNLLIGNSDSPAETPFVSHAAAPSEHNHISFSNNIIIDLGQGQMRLCSRYGADTAPSTINNNLYVGCNSWLAHDVSRRPKTFRGLERWKTHIGKENGSILLDKPVTMTDVEPETVILPYLDHVTDKGACSTPRQSTISSAARPANGKCNIGPYKYPPNPDQ